jgi:hypothetical protein
MTHYSSTVLYKKKAENNMAIQLAHAKTQPDREARAPTPNFQRAEQRQIKRGSKFDTFSSPTPGYY